MATKAKRKRCAPKPSPRSVFDRSPNYSSQRRRALQVVARSLFDLARELETLTERRFKVDDSDKTIALNSHDVHVINGAAFMLETAASCIDGLT